jgi:hypothetical protein
MKLADSAIQDSTAAANTGRCTCGWELGANLSGDCLRCNEAIAKLSTRRRRGNVVSNFDEAVACEAGDAPHACGTPDDEFEPEKEAKRPNATKQYAQSQRSLKEMQAKIHADDLLAQNGFTRCTRLENGTHTWSVQHPNWVLRYVPKDGHCLWHCFLGILQDRLPDSGIDNQRKLRQVVAEYFDSHQNCLQLDGSDWSCESLQAVRTGQDKSGKCLNYGGLSECVAFSLRFKISLEIHAPETMQGPFMIGGGGATDCAPEVLIQTLGWRGNRRSVASDHWQRMICRNRTISANIAVVAAGQNCIVSFDGNDVDAKVVRAFQFQVSEQETLLYCYGLQTSYGTPLGYFLPAQVRPAIIVQIDESSEEDFFSENNVAIEEPGAVSHVEQHGHETDASSQEEPSDEHDDDVEEHGHENDESSQEDHGYEDDDEECSVQESQDTNVSKRAPGRKPANGDVDTTSWCHDTLVCFLRTVVAHNPFAKHGAAKIAHKWQEIANDMARATRLLGVNAITARPEALRIKFGRLKIQLRNFRASGKSSRQSGLASVRAKNAELSELADIMDECVNLQKDVADQKKLKKSSEEAAKKCMHVTLNLISQK